MNDKTDKKEINSSEGDNITDDKLENKMKDLMIDENTLGDNPDSKKGKKGKNSKKKKGMDFLDYAKSNGIDLNIQYEDNSQTGYNNNYKNKYENNNQNKYENNQNYQNKYENNQNNQNYQNNQNNQNNQNYQNNKKFYSYDNKERYDNKDSGVNSNTNTNTNSNEDRQYKQKQGGYKKFNNSNYKKNYNRHGHGNNNQNYQHFQNDTNMQMMRQPGEIRQFNPYWHMDANHQQGPHDMMNKNTMNTMNTMNPNTNKFDQLSGMHQNQNPFQNGPVPFYLPNPNNPQMLEMNQQMMSQMMMQQMQMNPQQMQMNPQQMQQMQMNPQQMQQMNPQMQMHPNQFYGMQGMPMMNLNNNQQFEDSKALEKFIIDSIEYYFSEINLNKDYYFRSKLDNEGFINLLEISQFNKMKMKGITSIQMKGVVCEYESEIFDSRTTVEGFVYLRNKKWEEIKDSLTPIEKLEENMIAKKMQSKGQGQESNQQFMNPNFNQFNMGSYPEMIMTGNMGGNMNIGNNCDMQQMNNQNDQNDNN